MAINPLNIALTGLKTAQAQLAVTSNNVANASTSGYSRKTLEQYTVIIGGDTAGTQIGIVERSVNEILLRDYRTQISSVSGLSVRTQYLDRIQAFHGPPDSEQSISSYMGQLKDSFAQLASQPESSFLLNDVISKARRVTDKINDFSQTISNLRNFAQTEISESVARVNTLSQQIADLSLAIKKAVIREESAVDLEDQRDEVIKLLSEEIDISTFKTNEGVMNVMTREGQLLADTQVTKLSFTKDVLGPSSYYPFTISPLRLGNPITGIDLTTVDTLGGRIGELINLRDRILPTYQAQIDEVAHKTATRFSSQGLDMFTKLDGSIPANTPTGYVGFAAEMVINPEIISDYSVVRKGTSANSTVQTGSSEILRKVVEFAFGDTAYQQSRGTVDISNAVPTLFTTLGITGQARVIGTTNIQSLTPLDSSPSINPPTQNDFTLQVGAGVPQTITITAGMTASDLVTAINTAIPGMAQIGSGGELILRAGDTITIGAGTLGSAGLAELGLTVGATAATAPSFTIKAGNNPLTTISIISTDTSTQLLSKLNAVNGISATLTSGGFLNIIPTEGGDITVTDGIGAPLTALGMTQTNVAHTPFNSTGLGPAGTLSGEVTGASTIQNYISQAISLQSQEAQNTDTSFQSEETYRATIEKEYLNSTGVNIDEEMARLITIQTAYSASARTIQIAQEMIDELFSIFR